MASWTNYKRPGTGPGQLGDWQPVDDQALAELLRRSPESGLPLTADQPPARVASISLPFYAGLDLYEIVAGGAPAPDYLVCGEHICLRLDGQVETLWRLNAAAGLKLERDVVEDYVRFYLGHVELPDGRLLIAETLDDLRWSRILTVYDRAQIADKLLPVRAAPVDGDDDLFQVEGTAVQWDRLMHFSLQVRRDGHVRSRSASEILARLPVARDPLEDFVATPCGFGLETGWSAIDPQAVPQLLNLFQLPADTAAGADLFFWRELDFLPGFRLVGSRHEAHRQGMGLFALSGAGMDMLLNGTSAPVHAAREAIGLCLQPDQALDYLEFFCAFTHGDEGPFRIVCTLSDLNVTRRPTGFDEEALHYDGMAIHDLSRIVQPPQILGPAAESGWTIQACVQYGNALFSTVFEVSAAGVVTMLKDDSQVTDMPVNPELNAVPTPTGLTRPYPSPSPSREGVEAAAQEKPAVSGRTLLHTPEQAAVRAVIEAQLARALRTGQAAPLLEIDPGQTDGELIEALARFVFRACPVMIIESGISYCEGLVGQILREVARESPSRVRLYPITNPDTIRDGNLVELSLHTQPPYARSLHLAYQLGVTDAPALIGTPLYNAVPGALQRISDLYISLGDMDHALFRGVFGRLFECSWPEDISLDDEIWPLYVQPSDFFMPLRHRMVTRADRGEETAAGNEARTWSIRLALQQIRQRVKRRLAATSPGSGPNLVDMPGMGEARAVAEDLIQDIRDTLGGTITWDLVDRGLLLAGAPGTGKTWLAQAIARECDVRFVATSASDWIAGTEHLGEHLKRLHDVFSNARRYAPCVLFIDEFDSIGSREHFAGSNRHYSVEVVNALLQHLDGFERRTPVFVVAATNHLDQIDPALRRAGRLDQVITLTLPDRDGLVAMFEYHLRPFRNTGRVEDSVDLYHVAGLAIGATGADVERLVRDAARRARKDGKPISTRHLIAAVTGKPRDGVLRSFLGPEELARVALHEAGHACALRLCRHYPAELGLVSIVPDASGSLGVTRGLPQDMQCLSRAGYMERMQVLLAGRAAEEIGYGPALVSGGAGGLDTSSDLAKATQVAFYMVDRLGMGPGRRLYWGADTTGHLEQARGLITAAYHDVYEKLHSHQDVLMALRDVLLEEMEVLPETLERLWREHAPQHDAACAEGLRP